MSPGSQPAWLQTGQLLLLEAPRPRTHPLAVRHRQISWCRQQQRAHQRQGQVRQLQQQQQLLAHQARLDLVRPVTTTAPPKQVAPHGPQLAPSPV